MDWEKIRTDGYDRNIFNLTFEIRPARCFVVGKTAQSITPSIITSADEMQRWITDLSNELNGGTPLSPRSLTVLALKRGHPNVHERNGEASVDQLWNIGTTRGHFQNLFDQLSLPKSFPGCITCRQSYYSRNHTFSPPNQLTGMSFDIRSSPVELDDIALSSITTKINTAQNHTFAVVTGCVYEDYALIETWLNAMKDYAEHPVLMAVLFFELHRQRLSRRFDDLRALYINQHENTLSTPHDRQIPNWHQTQLRAANALSRNLTALDTELDAMKLRLPDVDQAIKLLNTTHPQEYGKFGDSLQENLTVFLREVNYLQAQTKKVASNADLLIPSVCPVDVDLALQELTKSQIWNVVAIQEAKITREISKNAKRDTSIMLGIAVGTLTFLPGTAMATIFGMPLLDWKAVPPKKITTDRFWIYTTVTCLLTAGTLAILFAWMYVAGMALERNTGVWNMLRRRRNH